jgi:hypothetical protein
MGENMGAPRVRKKEIERRRVDKKFSSWGWMRMTEEAIGW